MGPISAERLKAGEVISAIVRNYASVVAIVVAGVWTYNVFVRTEAPQLEQRAQWRSALSWRHGEAPGTCIAQLTAEFSNAGTTPIEVERVQVRVWNLDLPALGSAPVVSIDFDAARDGEALSDENIDRGLFVRRYPPGGNFHHAFEWIVPEATRGNLLFDVWFYLAGSDAGPLQASSWDAPCAGVAAVQSAG